MNKISILLLFSLTVAHSQVPVISYTTPNVFTNGQTITDLIPTATGGAIIAETLVSTFAGSGTVGSADGNGIAASFNLPTVVTIDSFGNIFVVDRSNHKIRKITPARDVTTFAGSGSIGSADGIGTAASFKYPDGAVFDSQNNLFVSDQSNHKIRKITPDGTVSTFAGTGLIGSADGIGILASFYYPAGMTVDAVDNLYVADYGNNKIRKITPNGTVTTFAGTGIAGSADGTVLTAQFNGATGVCIDPLGSIFVADYYSNKIRKISTIGDVTTIAGTGTIGSTDGIGTSASFYYPAIVAIDLNNNLFITDEENHKIRKITPDGMVSTYAGTGVIGATDGLATVAQFNSATGVAIDHSNTVFVCDYGNNKIRKIKTYGYSISPALPTGLLFNTSNGRISGTPTVVSPATDYTVTASNSDGMSTFVLNIAVNPELGIPNYVIPNIQIYPNPVTDILTITPSEGITAIKLVTLLGQEIVLNSTRSVGNKIDVSGLSDGCYIARISFGNIIKTIRFLKQ
ncbi:T9SS type A sorting domain-containing protein [Flavobacterium sp.]|uniref:T9SS type A sorting domain-containing protein n=1 Tax=Flavobacterium sp. TaxID=239 RepID=UPI0025CFCA66|nr:T9SS type A sorting domain-containing protein [Flavobacterium sp.]